MPTETSTSDNVWSAEVLQARQNALSAFAQAKAHARLAALRRSRSISSLRRRTDELDEATLLLDRALEHHAESLRLGWGRSPA